MSSYHMVVIETIWELHTLNSYTTASFIIESGSQAVAMLWPNFWCGLDFGLLLSKMLIAEMYD